MLDLTPSLPLFFLAMLEDKDAVVLVHRVRPYQDAAKGRESLAPIALSLSPMILRLRPIILRRDTVWRSSCPMTNVMGSLIV